MKDLNLADFAQAGLRFPELPDLDGYFTSEDARIYFAKFGHGQPVILLHGGMGNGTNWAKQIKALVDDNFTVYVLDTRAHGRSTSGIRPFSYGLLAGDLSRFMDNQGIPHGIMLGWSDGACTALELARIEPAKVTGVVFFACNVDPSGTLPFTMTEIIANCLKRHGADFSMMSPGLEDFQGLQPRLDWMQRNEPNYSKSVLASIEVPVAVIQGDADEFIKLDHARYLAESLANGRFEIMKGLSHFAPIQDPDMFNKVILKYLNEFRRLD